jgi:hypothetical protein
MMRYVWLALAAFLSANAMAANKEYSFFVDESKDKLCLSLGRLGLQTIIGTDAQDRSCSSGEKSVRIRILDAPEDASFPKGIYLERPFVIVDGIDLSTVEKRTITDLESDLQQVGLPNILKTLGYTPVLVQFTETVRRSLQQNSDIFSRLLAFLNDNKHIPFPGAKEEGFVIMGISQGGVIGRYGAYLYDSHRKPSDAPIRLFSSLDSPHQGAVMPMGLFSTVAFWSKQGASSAEMFKDMLQAKGAEDLLVYDNQCVSSLCYSKINVNSGFLFDDYRKAAEYKGFPSVLIAQGQLKGVSPVHKNDYYRLERHVEKGPFTLGSAISRMHYSDNGGVIAYNRKKEGASSPNYAEERDSSRYDFIQGSTYPFGATIYNAFREGFLDAIPNGMTKSLLGLSINLDASWGHDELIQDRSTFIPTVSAMDLKCNGDLAIRSDCGFTQSYSGFPFESPGNRSTAAATFAVDPTHPRFNEPISGRHIEMPSEENVLNKTVLEGMQVDMWRILCGVAKYDYDASVGHFRNPKLTGYFSPNASCMDLSKMPSIIATAGAVKKTTFAYARYDYNANANEKDVSVKFTLPAGWKKTALWDYGGNIQAKTSFEIDIKVENPKGNWMKAELLVCRTKSCSGYLQLNEQSVPLDGMNHVLRWQMPATAGALNGLRWFRLVLNSDGAEVELSNPHMIVDTQGDVPVPSKISSPMIYPNQYDYYPWDSDVHVNPYTDALGSGLEIKYDRARRGAHIEFGKMVSMDDFNNLVVDYWPGTCQNTLAYFDSKKLTKANLDNGSLQNVYVRKILPLDEIIDLDVYPQGSKSAHRLNLQAVVANERCVIKSITVE